MHIAPVETPYVHMDRLNPSKSHPPSQSPSNTNPSTKPITHPKTYLQQRHVGAHVDAVDAGGELAPVVQSDHDLFRGFGGTECGVCACGRGWGVEPTSHAGSYMHAHAQTHTYIHIHTRTHTRNGHSLHIPGPRRWHKSYTNTCLHTCGMAMYNSHTQTHTQCNSRTGSSALAEAITCALVTTRPSSETTKPEPCPVIGPCRCVMMSIKWCCGAWFE